MTKTEFLRQGIDDLRTALLDIFEDPDGELVEMNKPQLIAFARENWDTISGWYNTTPDPEPESPEEIAAAVLPPAEPEVEEAPLDLEPEPTPDESVATPDESDWEGDPGTNLHGGVPGHPVQKVGTRNLA